jgi:flagellar basal body-associated protein FliL
MMWEVVAMDDKELIKRIMEEVKDEKLREELLALVVEKNKKKDDTKREEEDPINYLARQAILGGATEGVAKVSWWIALIVFIVFTLVGSLGPLMLLGYFLTPAEERPRDAWVFIIFFSIMFIIGLSGVYDLLSGKKEYERFKRKKENQRQS